MMRSARTDMRFIFALPIASPSHDRVLTGVALELSESIEKLLLDDFDDEC